MPSLTVPLVGQVGALDADVPAVLTIVSPLATAPDRPPAVSVSVFPLMDRIVAVGIMAPLV